MTKEIRLPADSRHYAEKAYHEKERRRIKQTRMSFTRKIEALDRLLKNKGLVIHTNRPKS